MDLLLETLHMRYSPWHVVLVMCPLQFSFLIEFQFKFLKLKKETKLWIISELIIILPDVMAPHQFLSEGYVLYARVCDKKVFEKMSLTNAR